ncbi:hypothetical protein HN51_067460 [Arachis hypogaea]
MEHGNGPNKEHNNMNASEICTQKKQYRNSPYSHKETEQFNQGKACLHDVTCAPSLTRNEYSSGTLVITHHRHSYYEALNTFILFLSEMLSMVIGTNDITRGFLFLGINGVLIHELPLVNSLAFEKRNLLSFGEAFDMSLPPMVHISMMFFIFALDLVLLFAVYPVTPEHNVFFYSSAY